MLLINSQCSNGSKTSLKKNTAPFPCHMIVSSEIPQSSIPATFPFPCHSHPKSNKFPKLHPSFTLLVKFHSLLSRPQAQSQAGRPWEHQQLFLCSCSAKSKNVLDSTSSSHLSHCFVRHHLWVTGPWFTVLTKGSVDLPMWGTTGLIVPGKGGKSFGLTSTVFPLLQCSMEPTAPLCQIRRQPILKVTKNSQCCCRSFARVLPPHQCSSSLKVHWGRSSCQRQMPPASSNGEARGLWKLKMRYTVRQFVLV